MTDTNTDQVDDAASTGDAADADKSVDTAAQDPNTDAGTTDETGSQDETADPKEGDKAEDEPKGAPEAYEDFTAPEGVDLDADVMGEFKTLAKDLDLDQGSAQKVTDLAVKLSQKWADAQTARVAEMHAEWEAEAKADKEIGGDKLPDTLATAKKALDAYGTPALRELLDQSGMGNHPEMIRFAAKIGKLVGEDTFVGGGSSSSPSGDAKSFYPNSNMN